MSSRFYVSYQLGSWHMEFSPVSYAFDIYDNQTLFLQTLRTAIINLSKDCAIHFDGDSEPYQIFPNYKNYNGDSTVCEVDKNEEDDDRRYSVELAELLTTIDKMLLQQYDDPFEVPYFIDLGDFRFSIFVATSDLDIFWKFFLQTIIAELKGEEIFDELKNDNYDAKYFADIDNSFFEEYPIVKYIAEHFQDEVFPEDEFVNQFRSSRINERASFNINILEQLHETNDDD